MKNKNLLTFPVGTIGRDMAYQLFNNFILTYILFTRSLSTSQMMAITAIMVAARIFDAVNDPIMGNIIEGTRSRWGKFKPWLFVGIILTSFVIYMAFNVKLTGWKFIWFFGLMYFMYSITYTMHDISYWGMIPALGSDADERNRLTSAATLCAGIGGTAASVLIPMLTTGANALGGDTGYAYGKVALAVAILAPLFLLITIIGVHDNRNYTDQKPSPVSIKKIISTITGNDQLLWISVIFLIQQIGNGLILGGLGSTYIYFDFGYNGGLYSTFSIVGMMPTALLMIFYPLLSRKISRKKLLGKMAVVATAGYAIIFISGIMLSPTNIKFWLITAGYVFSNFGQYCFYLVMMISIINTVEYNEYKNGTRDEAIIASLRPFLTKLASALIIIITSASYIIFRITFYTNQISDLEQQTSLGIISESQKLDSITSVLQAVSRYQVNGLVICMALLPCVLMLISYFLYKKHYILDEAEYDRICMELKRN